MQDLNKVTLCGRLGQDLELRSSRTGNPFVRLSIETSRDFPKSNGELQSKSQWLQVYAFGAHARTLAAQAQKGSRLLIEGHLERQWVLADQVTLVSGDALVQNDEKAEVDAPSTSAS
jgi:single-strand DNA-binding protein